MTRETIKDAIRHCRTGGSCEGCPLANEDAELCVDVMTGAVLLPGYGEEGEEP